jgi:dihydrofolate reductase
VRLSLVAAVARGGVIGRDAGIPWRLPEDLQRFRAITMGHPVVMGRRTWESLPEQFRPLPGRGNVVVTRNPDWSAQGADRAGSIEDALRLLADELVLTEIDAEIEGDTFFPEWDPQDFEEVAREWRVTGDGVPFSFVTYERRAR